MSKGSIISLEDLNRLIIRFNNFEHEVKRRLDCLDYGHEWMPAGNGDVSCRRCSKYLEGAPIHLGTIKEMEAILNAKRGSHKKPPVVED